MPHFIPSVTESGEEGCFGVERGLELGGDWKAVSGRRPGTQMSSSHGLHLDIMISESLELCEPVVFVVCSFKLFHSSCKGKV